MQILRYKYYTKQITTRDNGNVQFHDQEESKLSNTINVDKGVHAVTHEKLISSFNQDNVATIKKK